MRQDSLPRAILGMTVMTCTAAHVFGLECRVRVMARACLWLSGPCGVAGIWELMQGKRERLEPTLKDAQDETEMVIFDAVENLLKTTNTAAQEACLLPTSLICWQLQRLSGRALAGRLH